MHKYTYTADFTLKCGQCGHGLKGEKEAVQHAQSTGKFALYYPIFSKRKFNLIKSIFSLYKYWSGHTKFVEYE